MNKLTQYNHTCLNPKQRELIELILNEVVPEIPKGRFRMNEYSSDHRKFYDFIENNKDPIHNMSECGTSCCLMGWAATHPELSKFVKMCTEFHYNDKDELDYIDFNQIGILFFDGDECSYWAIHDYLFECQYKSDLRLAKERMRYLLKYGFPYINPPFEWKEKFYKKTEL